MAVVGLVVGSADTCTQLACTFKSVALRNPMQSYYNKYSPVTAFCAFLTTMSFSSQKRTYNSYTPSGSSSRFPIVSGTQQNLNRYSKATSIQSHQESISNFSVHTTTAATHKDLLGPSGQGSPFPTSNNFSDTSRGRSHPISVCKSIHTLSKPTFGFRNQSLSTACSICEPESDRSSTATSTPSVSSLEDEADSESSPSPVFASAAEVHGVTRVRALRQFEPTERNELAFEKGDIIKVVNRDNKDWWRGRLKGRTGKFPVNYVVRCMPTSTSAFASAYVLMVFRNLFRNPHQLTWQPS
jgi:hypothetical protein